MCKIKTTEGVSNFVRRTRFELVKAMPADLQSAPVDRLGTDAFFLMKWAKNSISCLIFKTLHAMIFCMRFIYTVSVFLMTAVPSLVSAAIPTDLVPCGDSGEAACQTCHLYTLVENIFEWFFGIAALIVTIFIIVGGMRMVTSGGNQQAKKDARKMIGTAVVGFALVGSAWVLVDLLIATLAGAPTGSGIFTSIACVVQPG